MTMIAINTNYNIPTIIGDLLITGNVKPERFVLPSTGANILDQVDQDASLFPIRLTQKVYILQDNLVIAFAGNGPDIKRFLFDIRLHCKCHDDNITQKNLRRWLEEYELDEPDAISFGILFAETTGGKITLFQWLFGKWKKEDSETFEQTWATGSGAEAFLSEAKRNQGFTTVLSRKEVGYALQSNIILVAKILAKERLSLSTIQEYWGGGFEVTYFNGTKFSKFDELVYLIFQARQEEDESLSLPIPTLLMHYEYISEVLLITVINLQKGQTERKDEQLIMSSQQFNVTRYVVTPIDHTGAVDLGKFQHDTSFEVNKIGMGYIFETAKGNIIPASFYGGEGMQITYKHLKELKIVMNRGLNDSVVSVVEKTIQQ